MSHLRDWSQLGSRRRRSAGPLHNIVDTRPGIQIHIELVRERKEETWGLDLGELELESGQVLPHAIVRGVLPGSAAARSGVVIYDKILQVSAQPVTYEGAVSALRLQAFRSSILVERKRAIPMVERAWSATEEFMICVNTRLYILRSRNLQKLSQLGLDGIGCCTDLLKTQSRYVRCWDVSSGSRAEEEHKKFLFAVFGSHSFSMCKAYHRPLACVDRTVPGLREMLSLGVAIGAWLSSDGQNFAIIGDSSGAKLRAAFACVAANRVGSLLCEHLSHIDQIQPDSAVEAYDAYLELANLKSALPLESLPPSFKRTLSHLDAAIACRLAPNPRPLRILRLACTPIHNFSLFCSIHPQSPNHTMNRFPLHIFEHEDGVQELVAQPMIDVFDDFVVALTLENHESVIRFASNAAFLGPGSVSLPRKALDIFPKFRDNDKLPTNFSLVMRFAHVCDDGRIHPPDAGSPPPSSEAAKELFLWIRNTFTTGVRRLSSSTSLRSMAEEETKSSSTSSSSSSWWKIVGGGFDSASQQPPPSGNGFR